MTVVIAHAGADFAHVFTAPGSGALTDETFAANVVDSNGRRLAATATVTDAPARKVTLAIPAASWTQRHGGPATAQVDMLKDSARSRALSLNIRVRPNNARIRAGADYASSAWWGP